MLTNAKDGLQKLENINPLDWYRWLFGQSKIKKALGIMLIFTLIAFIVSPLILLEFSIFSRTKYIILSKETNKGHYEEDSGTWVNGECDLDEEQY